MVQVVFVLGGTRSGSTLLDRLLGVHLGAFSAGELRYIWSRGILQRGMCGCGESVSDCEFWRSVLARVAGHFQVPVADLATRMTAAQTSLRSRTALAPRWRLRQLGAGEETSFYLKVMAYLYDSIAETSGRSIIIDSSKSAADASLLGRQFGKGSSDRLYTINALIVRDPGAVAFSWSRSKSDRGQVSGASHMPRYGIAHSVFSWLALNLSGSVCVRRFGGSIIRYEALASSGMAEVDRLVSDLGFGASERAAGGSMVELPRGHTVGGNPDRFVAGATKIVVDDEWRMKTSPFRYRAISLLLSPIVRAITGGPVRPREPHRS